MHEAWAARAVLSTPSKITGISLNIESRYARNKPQRVIITGNDSIIRSAVFEIKLSALSEKRPYLVFRIFFRIHGKDNQQEYPPEVPARILKLERYRRPVISVGTDEKDMTVLLAAAGDDAVINSNTRK
jgi:hypothetical protein